MFLPQESFAPQIFQSFLMSHESTKTVTLKEEVKLVYM